MKVVTRLVCAGFLLSACDGRGPAEPTVDDTPVAAFVVTGSVIDTAGAPIGGALVDLSNGHSTGLSLLTDDSGRYRFTNVSGGIQLLRVSKDDYFTIYRSVLIDRDVDLTSRLQRAVALTVGEPLAGVVAPDDPVCDPDRYDANAPCGRFLLIAPASGTIDITLTWPDAAEHDLGLLTAPDQYIALAAGARGEARITQRVEKGVAYEVRVFNAGTAFTLLASLTPR
jgi:carboxypeptidase family protein